MGLGLEGVWGDIEQNTGAGGLQQEQYTLRKRVKREKASKSLRVAMLHGRIK